MDVIEEELLDYRSAEWTEADAYVVSVFVILLPAVILSVIAAVCVYYSRNISAKMKMFLKHLMVAYFVSTLFDTIEALRLHADTIGADGADASWFGYVYPIIVAALFAKYFIILLVFVHRERVKLPALRNVLHAIWCTALFYAIVLAVLTAESYHVYGDSLYTVPANINLAVFAVVLAFYLLEIAVHATRSLRMSIVDDEYEFKIRLGVAGLGLSCSLVHLCIERAVPLLWPYLSLYLIDTLEVIAIVVFIIKIDLDFSRLDVENTVHL